jgi:hypothetical protein
VRCRAGTRTPHLHQLGCVSGDMALAGSGVWGRSRPKSGPPSHDLDDRKPVVQRAICLAIALFVIRLPLCPIATRRFTTEIS